MASNVAHVLMHYGYLAVFLLIMLEDFGVPSPGETALVIGAVAAASGQLNIWLVMLVAFLGAVLGDNIGYAVGHFGGRPLVLNVGGRIGLTDERLQHAESFFDRYGDAIVIGARFVELLRQLNGVIAGTMGMPWPTFLVYNAIGAALWVGTWGAIGYFAGEHLRAIEATLLRFSWVALLALVVGIAVWLIRRRRHTSASEATVESEPHTAASSDDEE